MNWQLRINIKNEIKDLADFTEQFGSSYEYAGDNETKYIELAKKLEDKFYQYADAINELDKYAWDDLRNELDDLVMSATVENSYYVMENIYSICDGAAIWLEQ